MNDVCIVILNWNGKEMLKDCLSSLKQTKGVEYKTIVVDNGSTDGSFEYLNMYHPEIDKVRLPMNLGYSIGNNVGIKYASSAYRPKFVLILNNDTEIISHGWLKMMIDTSDRYDAGIVGCKSVYPDGKIINAGSDIRFMMHINLYNMEDDIGQGEDIKEVEFAAGFCWLIRCDVIRKIGLLDERLSPYFCEEIDYCYRARRAGFKVYYCGKAKLVHKIGSSTSKQSDDDRRFYITRNELIIAFRYYSLHWIIFEIMKAMRRNIISPVMFFKAFLQAVKMYGGVDGSL